MQDLKLKKLICLDKPAENNMVSAAPSPTDKKPETVAVQSAPKNIQAPNTGVQNTTGIITTILVLALILGLTTLIASKLSKKSKKIILSIFMLTTATFGGISAFSKLSYAETLVNGKPCQTTGYSDYEVGAEVDTTLDVRAQGNLTGITKFIKVKGTGDPEKDKAALKAEIDKLKDDKESIESMVTQFNINNPTLFLMHNINEQLSPDNFQFGISQKIIKEPKVDDEKQLYKIDAEYLSSNTGEPVRLVDHL